MVFALGMIFGAFILIVITILSEPNYNRHISQEEIEAGVEEIKSEEREFGRPLSVGNGEYDYVKRMSPEKRAEYARLSKEKIAKHFHYLDISIKDIKEK